MGGGYFFLKYTFLCVWVFGPCLTFSIFMSIMLRHVHININFSRIKLALWLLMSPAKCWLNSKFYLARFLTEFWKNCTIYTDCSFLPHSSIKANISYVDNWAVIIWHVCIFEKEQICWQRSHQHMTCFCCKVFKFQNIKI